MTLRHLRIFVTVCETGSATAAGEKLHLSQPSISLAISELEAYYGVKLFDRIARRLRITESGKQFLQYATHIVDLFDKLEQNVRQFDSTGYLRVGTSITIGNCLLPQYVNRFESSHPHMKISAIIENSESIEKRILNNEIDLGIIEGILHTPCICKMEIADDRLVLICGTNHRFAKMDEISLFELGKERLLLREKGSAGREIVDGILQSNGIEVMQFWESVSTQAIIRSVQEGLGISILPYLLVKDSLNQGTLKEVHIKNITLNRKLLLIYHENKFLTESMKDFMDICKLTEEVIE